MSSSSKPATEPNGELETAVDQAKEYLETEVGELMKAVSHAYARGRFHSYSG